MNGGITGPVNSTTASSSSGVWEVEEALAAKKAGKWQLPVPPPVVVFDETTGPNSAGTGGWYYQHGDGGSYVSIGTTSNAIWTYAPWWSSGNAVTNNNINTTGATSVTLVFQGYTDNQYGYAWVNFPGGGNTFIYPQQTYLSKQSFTLPVTNGGVGKLQFGAANTRQYNYLFSFQINYS
jgi:hypothetical protein